MPDATMEIDVRLRLLESIQKDLAKLRKGITIPVDLGIASGKAERLIAQVMSGMQRRVSRELRGIFEKEGLLPMLKSIEAVGQRAAQEALKLRSVQLLSGAEKPVEFAYPDPKTGEAVIPDFQVPGFDVRQIAKDAAVEFGEHLHAGAIEGFDKSRAAILRGGTPSQKAAAELASLSRKVRPTETDIGVAAYGKWGTVPDIESGPSTAASKAKLSKRIAKLVKDAKTTGVAITPQEQQAAFSAVFQQELADAEKKMQAGLRSDDPKTRTTAHEKVRQVVTANVKKRLAGVLTDGHEFERMIGDVLTSRREAYSELSEADQQQQSRLQKFLQESYHRQRKEFGLGPREALAQAEEETRQLGASVGLQGYAEQAISTSQLKKQVFNKKRREQEIREATEQLSPAEALPIAFATARQYPSKDPSGQLTRHSQRFLKSELALQPGIDPDAEMKEVQKRFRAVANAQGEQIKFVDQQLENFEALTKASRARRQPRRLAPDSALSPQMVKQLQAAGVVFVPKEAGVSPDLSDKNLPQPGKDTWAEMLGKMTRQLETDLMKKGPDFSVEGAAKIAAEAQKVIGGFATNPQQASQAREGVAAAVARGTAVAFMRQDEGRRPRHESREAVMDVQKRVGHVFKEAGLDVSDAVVPLHEMRREMENIFFAKGSRREGASPADRLYGARESQIKKAMQGRETILGTEAALRTGLDEAKGLSGHSSAVLQEKMGTFLRQTFQALPGKSRSDDATVAIQRLEKILSDLGMTAVAATPAVEKFEKEVAELDDSLTRKAMGLARQELHNIRQLEKAGIPSGDAVARSRGRLGGIQRQADREQASAFFEAELLKIQTPKPEKPDRATTQPATTQRDFRNIGRRHANEARKLAREWEGSPEYQKIMEQHLAAAEDEINSIPDQKNRNEARSSFFRVLPEHIRNWWTAGPPTPPPGGPMGPNPMPPVPPTPPTPTKGGKKGGTPPGPNDQLPWQIKRSLRTNIRQLDASTPVTFDRDLDIALGATGQVVEKTLGKMVNLTPKKLRDFYVRTVKKLMAADTTGTHTDLIQQEMQSHYAKGAAMSFLKKQALAKRGDLATHETPEQTRREVENVKDVVRKQFITMGMNITAAEEALKEIDETLMKGQKHLENAAKNKVFGRFSSAQLHHRIGGRIEGQNLYGKEAREGAQRLVDEELKEIGDLGIDDSTQEGKALIAKLRGSVVRAGARYTDPLAQSKELAAAKTRRTFEQAGPAGFSALNTKGTETALTEAAEEWDLIGDKFDKQAAVAKKTHGEQSTQFKDARANADYALAQSKLLNLQKERAVVLERQILEMQTKVIGLRAKGGKLNEMEAAGIDLKIQKKEGQLKNILNPEGGTSGHGMRQWNFGIQQLAYGVEDFFQVTSMGFGPLKGLLSAANNMGPALAMMGGSAAGASAAVAGLLAAVTLFTGMSDRKKPKIDDLVKSVNELADASERAAKFRFQMELATTPIGERSASSQQFEEIKKAFGGFERTALELERSARQLSIATDRAALGPGLQRGRDGAGGVIRDIIELKWLTQPSAGGVQNPFRSIADHLMLPFRPFFGAERVRQAKTPDEQFFGRPRTREEFLWEFGKTRGVGGFGEPFNKGQEFAHFAAAEREMTARREAFFAEGAPGQNMLKYSMELAARKKDIEHAIKRVNEAPPDVESAKNAMAVSRMLGRPEIAQQFAAGQFSAIGETRMMREEAVRNRKAVESRNQPEIERIGGIVNRLQESADFVQFARNTKGLIGNQPARMRDLMKEFEIEGDVKDRTTWLTLQNRILDKLEIQKAFAKPFAQENEDARKKEELARAAEKRAPEHFRAMIKEGPLMAAAAFGQVAPQIDQSGLLASELSRDQLETRKNNLKELWAEIEKLPMAEQAARKSTIDWISTITSFGDEFSGQIKQVEDAAQRFEIFKAFSAGLDRAAGLRKTFAETTLVGMGKSLGFDVELQDRKQEMIANRGEKLRQQLAGKIGNELEFETVTRMIAAQRADEERQSRESFLQGTAAKLNRNFDQALPEAQQAASFIREAQQQAKQAGLPELQGTLSGIHRAAKEAGLPIQDLAMQLGMTAEKSALLDKAIADLGDAAGPEAEKLRALAAHAGLRQEMQAIEQDPVVQLMQNANEFAAAVLTVDRALQDGVVLAKASNGALTEQQGAWLGLMGALKKAGYDVGDLGMRLSMLEQNANAVIGTIKDSKALTPEQKASAETQFQEQLRGKRFNEVYNSVEQQAVRSARGGFMDTRIYGAPGTQRTSGRMLNFRDQMESLKDERDKALAEINERKGESPEAKERARQLKLEEYKKKTQSAVGQMVGNSMGRVTMNSVEGLYQSIQQSLISDPSLAVEQRQLDVLEKMLSSMLAGRPLTKQEQAEADRFFGKSRAAEAAEEARRKAEKDPKRGGNVKDVDVKGKPPMNGQERKVALNDRMPVDVGEFNPKKMPGPPMDFTRDVAVQLDEQISVMVDLKMELIKQFEALRRDGIPQRMA